MYLSLSWRNLWRNKRRTIIVAASVFFAVLLAAVMRSAQLGSYEYMIDSSAKLFTGYIQVQGLGYWDNRSIDKSIIIKDENLQAISDLPHVASFTPRFEAFALVSNKHYTKVAQVTGISPEKENNMTRLKNKLIKGSYLEENSEGFLIAAGLAEMLHADIGDSVILYGQGYHGHIAAARLPVTGIVKFSFSELNNGLILLSLPKAQDVFSAPGRITSLPIVIDNIRNLESTVAAINSAILEDGQITMTWDEMLPELVQNIEVDNAGGMIMLFILYIVIGFGVFGTVMMMISERAREFGILVSVGMRKRKLIFVTTIESIFISFIGVIAGIAGSIPIVYYLHHNPIPITGDAAKTFDSLGIEAIFNFSTDFTLFINQALIVLIIALLTAVYPVLFIKKLKPVEALHG